MSFYLPRLELAVGPVGGGNVTYYTPTAPYGPGTVRLYLNGQLRPTDNVVETDPTSGQWIIVEPTAVPRTGDIVQVFYIDMRPGSALSLLGQTCRLHGRIITTDLQARLVDSARLSGTVADTAERSGSIRPVELLAGRLSSVVLRGSVKVCTPC